MPAVVLFMSAKNLRLIVATGVSKAVRTRYNSARKHKGSALCEQCCAFEKQQIEGRHVDWICPVVRTLMKLSSIIDGKLPV